MQMTKLKLSIEKNSNQLNAPIFRTLTKACTFKSRVASILSQQRGKTNEEDFFCYCSQYMYLFSSIICCDVIIGFE